MVRHMLDFDSLSPEGSSDEVLQLLRNRRDAAENVNEFTVLVKRMEAILACLDALNPERLLPIMEAENSVGVSPPLIEASEDIRRAFLTYLSDQPYCSLDVIPHCLVKNTGLEAHTSAPWITVVAALSDHGRRSEFGKSNTLAQAAAAYTTPTQMYGFGNQEAVPIGHGRLFDWPTSLAFAIRED
jgi:hypothetical protein